MALVRMVIVIGVASTLAAGGCASADDADGSAMAHEDNELSNGDGTLLGVSRQAITGTHQMCSVSLGGWRDTTQVPDAWTRADCKAFCNTVGAGIVELACLTDSGMEFFAPASCSGGSLPPVAFPNSCGWGD